MDINNNESLFQLMRFNILNSGISNLTKTPFDLAYIYAWENGVYPFFHDGADWHKPFKDQFKITENEVDKLSEFLDEKWIKRTPISFYELEKEFGVSSSTHSTGNWSRLKLILVCRYMFLNEMFDQKLWEGLTKNQKCPSEAFSICRPSDEHKIYFM